MCHGDRPRIEEPLGDEQTVYVRPKGYGEDVPVARRIDERELFLGNALAAASENCCRKFDYVHSVCTRAFSSTTHHHPLDDGPDNSWERFESAVDTARRLHRSEGSVLIYCKLGISRSSAVAATVIAAEENLRFHDALATVQDARPHAVPNPSLHELAVIYLASRPRDG